MPEIKERPILFSAPMVRAILDDQKTMTRRVVKFPEPSNSLGVWEPTTIGGNGVYDAHGNQAPEEAAIWHTRTGQTLLCPYGKPGDRLWVRETCRAEELSGGLDGVRYLADEAFIPIENSQEAGDNWINLYAYRRKKGATVGSIHMPRWASRILLEITGVRVERLQDISEDDAWAEGIEAIDGALDNDAIYAMAKKIGRSYEDAAPTFAVLWDSLYPACGWDVNPWVWVIEFRRITS